MFPGLIIKRSSLILLTILVALVLIISVARGVAQAQDLLPGYPDLRGKLLDTGATPPHALVPVKNQEITAGVPIIPGDNPLWWTRMVYQSYLSDNWEIIIAGSAATSRVNLTQHESNDARPRLNRGATSIVFNSDRSGNHDIYTMNSDGSGVSRITASIAPDYAASWSPDGNRIVFVSEREGNAEIFIAAADGSNPTRLTINQEVDASPVISPNGQQIAWVRYSGYLGTLWLMNIDGSNARPMYSRSYLQHPAWSPDGARIAFDADMDGDNWNELASVSNLGTDAKTLFDSSVPYVENWMGNWSSDGNWIVYNRVNYQVNNAGNFYITFTYIDRVRLDYGYPDYLTTDGYDMLPDWQSIDILAPSSQVKALPQYSRASGFQVHWEGTDLGPSGISNYDIQFRDGLNGEWLDWQSNLVDTSAVFSGTVRNTYYLRSRAHDDAGNIEPWPDDPLGDAATTLFTWQLSGKTVDMRGVPLPASPVSFDPSSLYPTLSDFSGNYLARVGASGNHLVGVSQIGFGEIPDLTLDINLDIKHDFVLPPLADSVFNGGFEQGLANWQIAGSLPVTVANEVFHSGSKAALVGIDCQEPCLTNPEIMPGDQVSSGSVSQIVVDRSGIAHVIWLSVYGRTVYYNNHPPNGIWSDPIAVGDDGDWSSVMAFDLAIDSQDNLFAAWISSADLDGGTYFAWKPGTSNAWSVPVRIADGFMPELVVDHHDNLYLLYASIAHGEWEIRKRTAQGTWEAPVRLGIGAANYPQGALAVGGDDTIHFLLPTSGTLEYRSLSSTGELSPKEILTNDYTYGMKAVVDSTGILYATWTVVAYPDYTAYYATRSPAGDWSLPMVFPDLEYVTDVVVDKNDSLHFVGSSAEEASVCKYLLRKTDTGWNNSVAIGQSDCSYSLALNQNGELHLVQTGFEISYRRTKLADADGQAQLTQVLTVPDDLHEPTLSWLYYLENHNSPSLSFQVSVSTSVTTTQVFTNAINSKWSHAWVDMTPWAGETVTITFSLEQAANEPYVRLSIDEVSLGSWETPILTELFPPRLEDWANQPITLTGENFISTPMVYLNDNLIDNVEWVDENHLRLYLPAYLLPGAYSVWVANPGGQRAVLPGALNLGWVNYLPYLNK